MYRLAPQIDDCPAGVKWTEIGMIPEEWDVIPLVEVAKVRSGIAKNANKHVSKPILVHYLRVANVQDGYLDLSEMSMISVGQEAITQYALLPGDVLMNEGGDLDKLGRGAIWRGEYSPCIHQNHVFVVRCGSKISSDYLNVWTSSEPARRYFMVAGKQTTNLASINKTALGQLPVALPPTKEQTAIANALSDVDALITSLERLITKKRAIKTATMQQLLTGKKRLPPFDKTHTGYKQTELGEIPEDWEVCSLGCVSDFINGRAYGLHEWETTGTPVIRLQNLTGRGSDYYYSNLPLPEKQYCEKGDLLFMWSATFGPIIWRGDKAIYHYHIWKVECKNKTDKSFLFYTLDEMTEKLKRASSSGGTMLHVTKEKMESTKIAFPPTEEQVAIANVLSDMDKEIHALEQRLTKTQQLKQGMMQELLTGKTRLV